MSSTNPQQSVNPTEKYPQQSVNPTEKFKGNSKVLSLLFELQQIDEVDKLVKDIPEIAIIGPQSSGKSTVLRRIIGIDILPVKPQGFEQQWTKNPIKVLMMPGTEKVYIKDGNTEKSINLVDGSVLKKAKELLFAEFQDEKKVEKKKLSNQETRIEIHHPKAVPICFTDIPGYCTYPKDVEALTRTMLENVLKNKNTVILFAHSSNQDLHGSNSVFSMIKESHEKTKCLDRTIGILTKCDLAKQDNKTTFKDYFSQKDEFSLKLGWVAVKNPKDEMNVDFESQIQEENKFFKDSYFRNAGVKNNFGIQHLIGYSTKILEKFVVDWYEENSKLIEEKKKELLKEKEMLGPEIDTDQISLFFRVIDDCVSEIQSKAFLSNKYGANELREEFDKFYTKMKDFKIFQDQKDQLLLDITKDSGVLSTANMNHQQFQNCFNNKLPTIEKEIEVLLETLLVMAFKIFDEVLGKFLFRFPKLFSEFRILIQGHYAQKKLELEGHLNFFMQAQHSLYDPQLVHSTLSNDVISNIIKRLDETISNSISLEIPKMMNEFLFYTTVNGIKNELLTNENYQALSGFFEEDEKIAQTQREC